MLQGFFPNTYTMTKNFAEQLVQDYRIRFGLPICIFRPSIVSTAVAEPYPGWADTINGVIGATIEFGRGTVASVLINPNAIVEIVPLDFSSNAILVSAWFDTINPYYKNSFYISNS